MRFSQLVPWKHESVGRVFSGHQVYNKYTKPPECVDIIRHEVFTAGALEARVRRTSVFRAPAGKTE